MSCGGCVINEFMLQCGVAEVAHGHFHQDFCIGTVPKQVTLLFQIAQSLVKSVKARTVIPLLPLELLEHGVIAQGLDLPGH